MTNDEILSMPAGRETDKLVAETIMDEKGQKQETGEVCEFNGFGVINRKIYSNENVYPQYSTDIAAAHEALETKHQYQITKKDGQYIVATWGNEHSGVRFGSADTLPLASCRSLLMWEI